MSDLLRVDRVEAARRLRWANLAMRVGGAITALGSVLPWAWVPVAGVRLPLPGMLGWGALTLLLGAWTLWRAPWWAAGPAGLACLAVAWRQHAMLPAAVKRVLAGLEGRLDPLNTLLARFGIDPISLFDVGAPWAQIRGPGMGIVLAGAILLIAGAALAGATAFGLRALSHCPACGYRAEPGRLAAFCVRCGSPMPQERACSVCHTLAEPGDAFCAVCGAGLT